MEEKALNQLLHVAIVLLLISGQVEAKKSKINDCLAKGLQVLLETRDIKRFKATFDLETKKVYYKVKFCKQFSMCFASSIDQEKVNEKIVNNIESWAKIIRVVQGKGSFMPYAKEAHSKEFGGPRDYYNCTKRFYIITYKPTQSDVKSVTSTLPSQNCLSGKVCSRTCLHKTEKRIKCHEVRIACNFKCSKKRSKKRKGRDLARTYWNYRSMQEKMQGITSQVSGNETSVV